MQVKYFAVLPHCQVHYLMRYGKVTMPQRGRAGVHGAMGA